MSGPPSLLADDLAEIGPRDARPVVNPAKVAGVRLSPVEGFVLSRVDGHTSYATICALTGLGEAATLEILRKLRRERLILNPGETAGSLLEQHDDGSAVTPAELAGAPDLDDTTKARIVRLHRKLSRLRAHELLGVAAAADLATVKRAYFAASKELHPDRYYGQQLGRFGGLLNDIFAHLTQAFEASKK